jgi:predicted nucleic-acid-binding Zn-ribbon protein
MTTTISQRIEFTCPQCGQVESLVLTGTGPRAWPSIQKHRYLFASCTRCGCTQVFTVRILQGHSNPDIVLESLFAD